MGPGKVILHTFLLEFLLMMDHLMLSPDDIYPTSQVNTIIDNSSVVTQLQAFLLGYRPKRAYPHDANIISHMYRRMTDDACTHFMLIHKIFTVVRQTSHSLPVTAELVILL